jgi:hypothetical protein
VIRTLITRPQPTAHLSLLFFLASLDE